MAILKELYPEIAKWTYEQLDEELRHFQEFLEDENSAVGRQDMYYEQALIEEIDRRGKELTKAIEDLFDKYGYEEAMEEFGRLYAEENTLEKN